MKWCLIIGLVFPMLVWAKPRAPMVNKLHLTSIEQDKDTNIYQVQLDFTPLTDSNRVIFSLKVPQNFKLIEGFTYWEGYLKSSESFQKILKLQGPLGIDGKIELAATMEMEGTKSTTRTMLNLTVSQISKTSSDPIDTKLRRE